MGNKFEDTKQKLKECFFGIDEQIDQVIKAFETWEAVKSYQVRPMTVCLWGLTGTGKTALINKAIELLDLTKKKFYIKFGSKTSGLDYDFSQNTCEETIYVLDEFQYFKTKKEGGDEIPRDEDNSTNIIWELLDGGIVNLYGRGQLYSYEASQLAYSIYTLMDLSHIGATLKNGIVSHPKLDVCLNKLHIPLQSEDNIDSFIRTYNIYEDGDCNTERPTASIESNGYGEHSLSIRMDDPQCNAQREIKSKTRGRLDDIMQLNFGSLFDHLRNKDLNYDFNSRGEFINFILKFKSISDLITFLTNAKDAKPKLETRDFTKSLIFVLGNLDECFTMSNDLNSDLDADYFYNKTKKITILDIRKSLLTRFRSEQIARLGSTHIIYPSLNKNAFERIIDKELQSFKDIVLKKFPDNISDVTFSPNIKSLIYKEGVFPIIGARSVFSTINEIIFDKFTYIISAMLSMKDKTNIQILFDYNKSKAIIQIRILDSDGILINEHSFKYTIKVDNLRAETNKGKQTHIAVHEAGHAVCSIILEHSFPEVIYSVVLAAKNTGFNLFDTDDFYCERRNTFINSIAKYLGGYAAEEYIFGEENISNGSSSDIRKATVGLFSLFKDCGILPGVLGSYTSKSFTSTMFETSNYSLTDNEEKIAAAVETYLKDALILAKETLATEKVLLLKISEYLSKNPKITRKKLKELTKKYVVSTNMEELNKNKEEFYLDILNEELKIIKLK